MSTQISLKLSDKIFDSARIHAGLKGFDTLQDFIRELIREELFENESVHGLQTSLASEESLAKNWLTKEEDEAWAHLQKQI